MEYLDNPAGRLHKFLVDLGQQPGHVQAWPAMASVLGVEDPVTDQVTLFRRLSVIVSYPIRIEELIRSVDGEDHDLLLRWTPSVRNTLGQAGAAAMQVSQFRAPISAEVLLGLEMCSSTLHRRLREPDLHEQGIENLRLLIDAFIEDLEVATEGLPDYLRASLRDISFRLRDAVADIMVIRDHSLLGYAVETAVGWSVLHKAEQDDEGSKPFIQKLGRIVIAGLSALSFAAGDYELAAGFFPQLPHGETTTIVQEPPILDVIVVEETEPQPPTADAPGAGASELVPPTEASAHEGQ